MFITPSFKKSLIVEQFQGNYLKILTVLCASIILEDILWTEGETSFHF